jgi:hypothetical protein|tara:strand:- start:34672 stop:35079 length:408 start_codon:yes stop_codon:yes gene_type:complete
MKRESFLTEFLGALGAESLTFTNIVNETISGTVHYRQRFDDEDEEDLRQDFRWHMTEENVPSINVFKLIELIHQQNLLDIDQLIISSEELRDRYNESINSVFTQQEFNHILGELENVVVRMVDDGEETDSYFIHE